MKIDGAGAVLVIHVISEMKRRGRLIVKIHESDDMVHIWDIRNGYVGIFGMLLDISRYCIIGGSV